MSVQTMKRQPSMIRKIFLGKTALVVWIMIAVGVFVNRPENEAVVGAVHAERDRPQIPETRTAPVFDPERAWILKALNTRGLYLEHWKWELRRTGTTVAKGRVRNDYGKVLRAVEVNLIYLDSKDEIVGTGSTYLREPFLLPGAVANFVDYERIPSSAVSARVEFRLGGLPLKVIKPNDAVQVEAVQRALVYLGFNVGGVDGSFGPKTRAALEAFGWSEINRQSLSALERAVMTHGVGESADK